jgi:DNA-binding CsgD family transcriptional regulator
MVKYHELGIETVYCFMEFAMRDFTSMKVSISSRELEILRKSVYGLRPDQIASELMISSREVEKSLKGVLRNTQSKEPLQAMQILAKKGFLITE